MKKSALCCRWLICALLVSPVLAEPNAMEVLQKQLGVAQEQVEDLANLVEDLRRDMKAQELEVNAMRERALKGQADGRKRAMAAEALVKDLQSQLVAAENKIRQLESAMTVKPPSSPDAPPAVAREPLPATDPLIEPVFYGLTSAQLVREYERVLGLLKAALVTNPLTTFRLTGHSNLEGDESVNLRQSAIRAESLAKFLTGRGVPRSALQVVAAGAKHPLREPNSTEGRKLNRRVEIEIIR